MIYLDSSAAVPLLLKEPNSTAALQLLTEGKASGRRIVSSELLRIELYRVAVRESLSLQPVTDVLASVDLMRITPAIVDGACSIDHPVKSLDAIHLATAVRIRTAMPQLELFSYDTTMRRVATRLGIDLVADMGTQA